MLDAAATMLNWMSCMRYGQWYLVTRTSHYKRETVSVPICSTRHYFLFQMPSNSPLTAIPSYRKVLLDQIKNSREILSFDPSNFELKPFLWYVLLHWLSRKLKTKTWGQACGRQKTRDAGCIARVSCATQIPGAALFVPTLMDDQRRISINRS